MVSSYNNIQWAFRKELIFQYLPLGNIRIFCTDSFFHMKIQHYVTFNKNTPVEHPFSIFCKSSRYYQQLCFL